MQVADGPPKDDVTFRDLRRCPGRSGCRNSTLRTSGLAQDFENYSVFLPKEQHEQALATVLDQVVTWSKALAPVREAAKA